MRKTLRGCRFMLQTSFQAAPLLTIGTFGLTALGALLVPAGFWATKLLVDALFERDGPAVGRAILLLAVVRVAAQLALNFGMTTFRMNMEDRTRLHIDSLILRLGAGIPGIEHFERKDFADEMALLRSQAGSLAQPAGPLVFLLQVILTGAATLSLLASLHPALLLVPLFGIPGVVIGARTAKINQRAQEAVTERLRLGTLLLGLGTGSVPGKEVRIFGLAPELHRRLDHLQVETLGEQTAARVKATVLTTAGTLIFAIAYIAGISLVANEAIAGRATAGDVLLALTATATVSGTVAAAVTNANWLSGTLTTINRFLWLVDYAEEADRPPAEPADVPARIRHAITFDNVSFNYPGTDRPVLRDVNLELPAGSTVAIVGDNGAGKTTIVKLLCRFYEPTTGAIRLDGIDLERFDHREWRARMSGGFQDFARFEFLARETVGVGDLPRIHDDEAVLGALDHASASDVLTELPTGLDTQLGKSFQDGFDLSTGQWQKLALGRALMRDDPLLLVLDEPTASLDAQTEHALFERYAGSARRTAQATGAVTILVSHRFSTVRMADLIVVVEDGRISETGNHQDLIALGGTYAELYDIQASAYR